MSEFYVERQYWARWPKVLLMCRKHGNQNTGAVTVERRRYMPERTCECDSTISWKWNAPVEFYEHELSCGHVITSTEPEPPNYCEECGAKVVSE